MSFKIKKRSVIIGRHKSSISLEDEFWDSLKEIAHQEQRPLSALMTLIDEQRRRTNLSSAVRLYVLNYYKTVASLAHPTAKTRGDADTRDAS